LGNALVNDVQADLGETIYVGLAGAEVAAFYGVLKQPVIATPSRWTTAFELFMLISEISFQAESELSQRELQVLKQIALGKSNKEIGQVLYISERTVKNHVTAILEKLNAAGRTEAVALAAQRGLVNVG
jgi:DNA-binding NarL/FixJ family response regulator